MGWIIWGAGVEQYKVQKCVAQSGSEWDFKAFVSGLFFEPAFECNCGGS
jgi:hypothetical protein